MILVSIDDHVIEPRDMFDHHVPDRWKDQAPAERRQRPGDRALGVPGGGEWLGQPQRRRRLAEGGLGHGSHHLRRDAPRGLRHRRAGARHEPQRDPGLDVLPVLRRLQRRLLPALGGQGAGAGDDPGLQRLAHRRVGGVPSGAVHPSGHSARLGSGRPGGRGPPGGRQGLPGHDHAGAAPHAGSAQLSQRGLLGSVLPGRVRGAGGHVPAHRPGLRRHQQPPTPPSTT